LRLLVCCYHRSVLSCVTCFCSILRRPPPSTLFPYTTLFLSTRVSGFGATAVMGHRASLCWPCLCGANRGGRRNRLPFRPCLGPEDRKSTRLNSSHVKISYAVFCLKKKIADVGQGTPPQTHAL